MPSTSRWLVGSSSSSSSGSRTSSRAMASRFFQPPESVVRRLRFVREAGLAHRHGHAPVDARARRGAWSPSASRRTEPTSRPARRPGPAARSRCAGACARRACRTRAPRGRPGSSAASTCRSRSGPRGRRGRPRRRRATGPRRAAPRRRPWRAPGRRRAAQATPLRPATRASFARRFSCLMRCSSRRALLHVRTRRDQTSATGRRARV